MRFHMSNGAWIFATGIGMALIGSAGVYAAANSIVAIGNQSGTTTAYVTPTRQLQTVTTAPTNLVRALKVVVSGSGCMNVYTPPAGKGIVVTQVTYDINSGTEGNEIYATISDSCGTPADYADTIHAFEAQSHTFPTGMALASVGSVAGGGSGYTIVTITGYLIPSSQLPPEQPSVRGRFKGLAER